MPALLIAILVGLVGSVIARMLLGAGLAIASHVWITDYITAALDFITAGLLSTGSAGSILFMAGVGEGLSILGGAMIARATIDAARIFLVRAG